MNEEVKEVDRLVSGLQVNNRLNTILKKIKTIYSKCKDLYEKGKMTKKEIDSVNRRINEFLDKKYEKITEQENNEKTGKQ